MALIKCPECGREISDKAASCPNCGCPASEFGSENQGYTGFTPANEEPEDTQSEFDRIADEIFWQKPNAFLKSAKILSKRVDMPRKDAEAMILAKWKGWKKDKKSGKFPDDQFCPCCGSQDIMWYDDPGLSVTDYNKGFKSFITITAPSTMMMRCNMCRHRWEPKNKRR